LTSTIEGCGSAEAIKAYRYHTTRYNLEKAIMTVIHSNPHIYLDTIPRTVIVRRNPNDNSDTTTMVINAEDYTGKERDQILADYAARTMIRIKVGQIENTYVFRYFGSEQFWKKSPSSEIFIIVAHDKSGNGLEQGQNEHGQFKSKMAKEFTELFEKELLIKVNQVLNLKYAVGDL